MSNQEENSIQNEGNNANPNQENTSSKESNESLDAQSSGASGDGHTQDPVHNTGNDRMMIDEEGGEVGPDDQV